MPLIELLKASPELLIGITAFFGLLVGSFLNVVIYRIPVMMERGFQQEARAILGLPEAAKAPPFNLLTPASRCGSCGAAIKPWHNVPVLGWLLLRGKAACCQAPISVRYPLVEALTAAVAGIVAWRFGATPEMLMVLALSMALLALSFIDFDTQLLPDSITLPLLWAGLLANLLGWGLPGVSLSAAVIGAIAGYLSLWSVYWGFKLVTGKEGMGYGDFKLLAALGAWLGWMALPQIILLSSLVGAVLGGGLMLSGVLKRGQAMPFGPYLAVAGWLTLVGVNALRWLGIA